MLDNKPAEELQVDTLDDDTKIFKIFKDKEFKMEFNLASINGDEKYDLAV
jgi:hypothetical protein